LSVLAGFLALGLRGDLSAIVDLVLVVRVAVGVHADEEVEHLADGMVGEEAPTSQCRAILLGRNPHPNDVAHRRHVGQTP
jgi:hypothetical protein